MTVTTRTALGATTANRKWYCDVATLATPTVFVGLFGSTELKVNPGTVSHTDTSDFEGEGYTAAEAFSAGWGAEGKVRRGTLATTPTEYDPGQEIVRIAGQSMGAANQIIARFYEMEPDGPRVEAVTGFVNVTWSEDGGAVTVGSMASFTLVGHGKPTSRVHPEVVV